MATGYFVCADPLLVGVVDVPAVQAHDLSLFAFQREDQAVPHLSPCGIVVTDRDPLRVEPSFLQVGLGFVGFLYVGQESFEQLLIRWFGFAVAGKLLGLQDGFMFGALVHPHDKVDHIAAAGITVGAKARPGIRLPVDLKAWGLVFVEGTAQHVVGVGLQAVVVQDLPDGELLFDLSDLHRQGV